MANQGDYRRFGATQSKLEAVADGSRSRKVVIQTEGIDARDGKESIDAMALEAAKAKGLFEAFRCPSVRDPARRRRRRKECVEMFFLVRKTFGEECTVLYARFLEMGLGVVVLMVDDRVQEILTIAPPLKDSLSLKRAKLHVALA